MLIDRLFNCVQVLAISFNKESPISTMSISKQTNKGHFYTKVLTQNSFCSLQPDIKQYLPSWTQLSNNHRIRNNLSTVSAHWSGTLTRSRLALQGICSCTAWRTQRWSLSFVIINTSSKKLMSSTLRVLPIFSNICPIPAPVKPLHSICEDFGKGFNYK